jgi:hypothetical protein
MPIGDSPPSCLTTTCFVFAQAYGRKGVTGGHGQCAPHFLVKTSRIGKAQEIAPLGAPDVRPVSGKYRYLARIRANTSGALPNDHSLAFATMPSGPKYLENSSGEISVSSALGRRRSTRLRRSSHPGGGPASNCRLSCSALRSALTLIIASKYAK